MMTQARSLLSIQSIVRSGKLRRKRAARKAACKRVGPDSTALPFEEISRPFRLSKSVRPVSTLRRRLGCLLLGNRLQPLRSALARCYESRSSLKAGLQHRPRNPISETCEGTRGRAFIAPIGATLEERTFSSDNPKLKRLGLCPEGAMDNRHGSHLSKVLCSNISFASCAFGNVKNAVAPFGHRVP